MRNPQFYFLGGGLASLAAAACLSREFGFPGNAIHILEGLFPFPTDDERMESLFSGFSLPGIDLPVRRVFRRWLRGADFRPDWTGTHLDFEESDEITVTAIHCTTPKGIPEMLQLHEGDLCFASLGDPLDRASAGDLYLPPPRRPGLPDSARLWAELADCDTVFGNPVPFYSRPQRTGRVLFSISLAESGIDRIRSRLGRADEKYAEIPGSPWRLSVRFERDAKGGKPCLKGSGRSHGSAGQFVGKPMLDCCGKDIFCELLSLLGFPEEAAAPLQYITGAIVCAAPWFGTAFVPHGIKDSPPPIPAGSANLALFPPSAGGVVQSACDTVRRLAGAL